MHCGWGSNCDYVERVVNTRSQREVDTQRRSNWVSYIWYGSSRFALVYIQGKAYNVHSPPAPLLAAPATPRRSYRIISRMQLLPEEILDVLLKPTLRLDHKVLLVHLLGGGLLPVGEAPAGTAVLRKEARPIFRHRNQARENSTERTEAFGRVRTTRGWRRVGT